MSAEPGEAGSAQRARPADERPDHLRANIAIGASTPIDRRRSEIDVQLSAADLPAPRKARLETTQSLLRLAGRPAGGRARQAVPRALRPDRRQSRRHHRRRRARRLARASSGPSMAAATRAGAASGRRRRRHGRGRSARLSPPCRTGEPVWAAAAAQTQRTCPCYAAAPVRCRQHGGEPPMTPFPDWTPAGRDPGGAAAVPRRFRDRRGGLSRASARCRRGRRDHRADRQRPFARRSTPAPSTSSARCCG